MACSRPALGSGDSDRQAVLTGAGLVLSEEVVGRLTESQVTALVDAYNALKLYLILTAPQQHADTDFLSVAIPSAWRAVVAPTGIRLFGGEAITGSPSKPGKDRLDDVGKSVALGKEETPFHWIQMPAEYDPPMITQREALERFNAQSKDAEDHTRAVRKSARHSHHEREETPREARARLEVDSSTWKNNSYHSAVLRSPENHRWVTAMDIAIGQAKCLDDPVMREVLVAIADWKLDKERFDLVCKLPGWSRLSAEARALVEASYFYYDKGKFPSADLVSLTPPLLVLGIQKKEPSDE
jgi:hypothetical protein